MANIALVPEAEINNEENPARCTLFFRRHSKKTLFAVVVVVVVAAGIAIGLYFEYRTTNKKVLTEIKNNSSFVGGYKSNENICIYRASQDLLDKRREHPLGENCQHNSSYVNNTCHRGSSHACEKCEEILLPSVCFCDEKIQCSSSHGSQPLDRKQKQPCSFCLKAFKSSMYENRGNCTCNEENLNCTCNPGYGGFMCSIIVDLVCELNMTVSSSIPLCNAKNGEPCRITVDNKKQYICKIPTESNIDRKNPPPECSKKI